MDPSPLSGPSSTNSAGQRRRWISKFKEIGLDDGSEEIAATTSQGAPLHGRSHSLDAAALYHDIDTDTDDSEIDTPRLEKSDPTIRRSNFRSMTRLHLLALILVITIPVLQNLPFAGVFGQGIIGVEGRVVERSAVQERATIDGELMSRDNSPTDVCTRWSHQSAVINGTVYIYGGRASSHPQQINDTWNNNLLTLDLTNTWQISSPTLKGLAQPSGPPPVANGYLWNSYTSLFLYGGEYSDKPVTTPAPYAMWEYDIPSSKWIKHDNPTTSQGNGSDGGNHPVQEAAEGAGISVPELGRGWYFGGHQDAYTTAGWQIWFPRVYLKSLIEFTFPGFANDGVQSLSGGKTAGRDGAWRNVTQGGLQEQAGFTERADGVLVYVPGYGKEGIILGLAGGTNTTFTQMNVIDVYDVANSTWYKQATSGPTPGIRVNPCAVAASAADGSSTNVYLYGGQNLIPAGSQEQYDDMWILTIPSFTWIKVDTNNQSVPPARAGHTCHIWDGQIIVVGGYVGQNISCDSPGFYVFDASGLKWQNQFKALTGGNTQNQQASQSKNNTGLSGSYGYQVPGAVQSVIGGHASGGATITAPAQAASQGPLATGKPIIYTVTAADGAVVTETAGSSANGGGSYGSGGSGGPNIAAIVAGVVAGCFAVLAGYLGFCAWVYRRQLALYKQHVAMSQRAAAGGPIEKNGFMFPRASGGSSDRPTKFSTDQSSGPTASAAGASGSGSGYTSIPVQPPMGGNSTANSSTDDLMAGQEPSFLGVMLNPRRSLRVINRD